MGYCRRKTDSMKKRIQNYLMKEREKEGGPVFKSFDQIVNYIEKYFGDDYDDTRGTASKALNRHSPGGQHKGDEFYAMDTFYKDERGENTFWALLCDKDLKTFHQYTKSWRSKSFKPNKHDPVRDIYVPKDASDILNFNFSNISQLERVTLFKDENGQESYYRRDKRGDEVACYFIESEDAMKIGKSKDPRSRIMAHNSRMKVFDFVIFPQNSNISEEKIKNRFSNYQHPEFTSDEVFVKNKDTKSFLQKRKDAMIEVVDALQTDEVNIERSMALNDKAGQFFEL